MKTDQSYEFAGMRGRPIPAWRWPIALILPVLAFAQLPAPKMRAEDTPPEYHVKAAYLFNFLEFVEYPSKSFLDPLAPMITGVGGDDPFENALQQAVIGKTVQGLDLVVHVCRAGEDSRALTSRSSAPPKEEGCR